MFPPVLGKAHFPFSAAPFLDEVVLSSTWPCRDHMLSPCGPRTRTSVHLHDLPESCTPRGRRVSILGPWTLTSILADGCIFWNFATILIVAALAVLMAVRVLHVSVVFGIKLQFHAHALDFLIQAHAHWDHLHPQLLSTSPLDVVEPQQASSGRVPEHLHVDPIVHGDHPVWLTQVSPEIFHDTRMLIFRRHNAYSQALLFLLVFFVSHTLLRVRR